jgi:methionine synthase / methylenetetrahydrofolate reductase(NADPH)
MTPRASFRDLVEDGRVHVLDGAMGTLLYARGVFVNVCYDALVLEQPELVARIHAEYAAAGAEIVETNTFGANPVKLSAYGLEEKTREINREAARLARRAAPGALVAGSVGPLGVRIEPWGPTATDEAQDYFRRQVEGLLEGEVDGFVLETFSDVNELQAAYRAVRCLSDLPVVAQMTIGADLRTTYGTEPETLAVELDALGAEVVGLNCSVGPAIILDALDVMGQRTALPLAAQPNAGLPRPVGDRRIYMASPDYMAQYARRLMDMGARFVGGCCGTTPDHIRRLADTVRSVQPRNSVVAVRFPAEEKEVAKASERVSAGSDVSAAPGTQAAPGAQAAPPAPPAEGARELGGVPPVPTERRSVFGAALVRGEFMKTMELLPPRGWDPAGMVTAAREARDAGVHAVSLVDSPRGRSRMGAIAAGLLVQQQAGVEAVVHYSCRDRNMMGMISDLLGAAAGGIRNLLLVSGDPPAQVHYPPSTAVFDIDSIGLTNVVHGLNRGLDPGENSIGAPTRFVMGVAANPGAVDLEREESRFMWKVKAGADFAITQPVFDVKALERFLERVARWPLPILAAVWPLRSVREAEFLANEVPGVIVPEGVIQRLRDVEGRGPEAVKEEGLAVARETLSAVAPLVRGIHLHTPGGEVERALAVLDE